MLLDPDGAGTLTDWRTLLVASLFAVIVGLLTAVAPALLAIRGDLAGAAGHPR